MPVQCLCVCRVVCEQVVVVMVCAHSSAYDVLGSMLVFNPAPVPLMHQSVEHLPCRFECLGGVYVKQHVPDFAPSART